MIALAAQRGEYALMRLLLKPEPSMRGLCASLTIDEYGAAQSLLGGAGQSVSQSVSQSTFHFF